MRSSEAGERRGVGRSAGGGRDIRGRLGREFHVRGPIDAGPADRGSVSAEAAVVIPALVLFTMTLVWALTAAAAQIQCVDAARIGARAVARSEPRAAAVSAARSAAPPGARITVGRAGELWRVRVEAPTPGPGTIALTLSAEAAALAEPGMPGPSGAGDGADSGTGTGNSGGAADAPDTSRGKEDPGARGTSDGLRAAGVGRAPDGAGAVGGGGEGAGPGVSAGVGVPIRSGSPKVTRTRFGESEVAV
ncbi:TadE family type IV pilus minor pilin [Streptomyces sp. NBC_00859]|uniref:TadE family type IV pilus minor pilin n=1 Tax=Streptomyces sp. NBC_00859 TaxID=2903682 RepID=UPI00386B9615